MLWSVFFFFARIQVTVLNVYWQLYGDVNHNKHTQTPNITFLDTTACNFSLCKISFVCYRRIPCPFYRSESFICQLIDKGASVHRYFKQTDIRKKAFRKVGFSQQSYGENFKNSFFVSFKKWIHIDILYRPFEIVSASS